MNQKLLVDLLNDLKGLFIPKNQKLVPVKVYANNRRKTLSK
jgi:hypothetical protein